MKYFFAIMMAGFFWANIALGNAQEDAFRAANQAYQSRNYEAAASAYEQLLSEGYLSPELYYNLGNSYWKAGETGKAVLNYERALRLAPKDADLLHNLEIVRSKLQDEIETLPSFFLAEWWNALVKLLPGNGWTMLSILFFWGFAAGIYFWLFGKDRAQKKKGFLGAVALLLFTLLSFMLSYSQKSQLASDHEAIVLASEIDLMSGPDSESIKILELHEGTKVLILDRIGEWFKIQLANGDQGWLGEESIERI